MTLQRYSSSLRVTPKSALKSKPMVAPQNEAPAIPPSGTSSFPSIGGFLMYEASQLFGGEDDKKTKEKK